MNESSLVALMVRKCESSLQLLNELFDNRFDVILPMLPLFDPAKD
jgi:hypothetical protein